jgi:hypothetical protein
MKVQEIHLKDSLPFDSPETFRSFQLGKIKLLEEELNRLNLLEHPCEIQALCKQIIIIKEQLLKAKPQVK